MTSRFEPNLGGNWYVIVQDCRPRFADHNLSIRVCMGRRLELILMCFIPEHAIDPQSLFAIQYPLQFNSFSPIILYANLWHIFTYIVGTPGMPKDFKNTRRYKHGKRRFEYADLNKDGQLSIHEFVYFLNPEEGKHMRGSLVLVSKLFLIQIKLDYEISNSLVNIICLT